jgi:DNA-binding NarL/FixJ family response regulator
MFTNEEWSEIAAQMRLTVRQTEVVRGVFDGMPDKQIAIAMGVTHSAVRAHMRQISRKLGTRGRTEIILAVFQRYVDLCRGAQPSCC